jgi:hypothetical protein
VAIAQPLLTNKEKKDVNRVSPLVERGVSTVKALIRPGIDVVQQLSNRERKLRKPIFIDHGSSRFVMIQLGDDHLWPHLSPSVVANRFPGLYREPQALDRDQGPPQQPTIDLGRKVDH